MSKEYWVYIITNKRRTTIYTGVTNDIRKRVADHRRGEGGEFSAKYNLQHLVYYERFVDIHRAIAREKRLKSWSRAWKDELIMQDNPEWADLAAGW